MARLVEILINSKTHNGKTIYYHNLLEATRNALLTPDDYRLLLDIRIQIRFHPP